VPDPADTGRVLGLDLGDVRIGVAISDPERRLAVPLGTVHVGRPPGEMRAIADLVNGNDVTLVVIGEPISLDGVRRERATHAASFADERPATRTNNAEWDGYEDGYNLFDVRHTFNFSALYNTPGTGALTGGWSLGGIFNARSGLPMEVQIARNDVVYVDAAGNAFNNPGAGLTAVVNTPGGGASRNVRRPDLVPGVDPFIQDGGLLILNPAAFATPKPGTNGNLERNSLHGPNFWQVDAVIAKRIGPARGPSGELRMEIFNLFNQANLSGVGASLPNALPTSSLTEANRVQPGQPFTSAAAGTFGRATSTVGTTVGIGTNRQIQLAFRLNF